MGSLVCCVPSPIGQILKYVRKAALDKGILNEIKKSKQIKMIFKLFLPFSKQSVRCSALVRGEVVLGTEPVPTDA